jgi:hypothetical protein
MQEYKDFRPTAFDHKGAFLADNQNWLVIPVMQTRDSGPLDLSNFEVNMLHIRTPYGKEFEINKAGQIIRMDMEFTPSDDWKFLGISHVKRREFIAFTQLTPDVIKTLKLRYKNGKPQYTVIDLDHGTRREWGNTTAHGIQSLWFD